MNTNIDIDMGIGANITIDMMIRIYIQEQIKI